MSNAGDVLDHSLLFLDIIKPFIYGRLVDVFGEDRWWNIGVINNVGTCVGKYDLRRVKGKKRLDEIDVYLACRIIDGNKNIFKNYKPSEGSKLDDRFFHLVNQVKHKRTVFISHLTSQISDVERDDIINIMDEVLYYVNSGYEKSVVPCTIVKGRNPPIQKDVIATSVSVEHNPAHGTEHIQPEETEGNGIGLSSHSDVGRPDDIECGCIDPIENCDEPMDSEYPIELETIEGVPESGYFDQKDCVCIWSNEGKECFRFGCYIGSRRISDHAIVGDDDILKPMVDLGEYVGKGRRSYNNGEYYDGSLFHGLRHGIGRMIDRKGVQYNPGMYSNDMYMGRVVYSDCPLNNLNDESLHYVRIQYKNGSEYEGQLRNGMINGQGILKLGDGTSKNGTFWHNSFLGEVHTFDDLDHDLSDLDSYSGEISISNGHIQFSGHWDKGSLEGSGKLSIKNNYSYSGEWHENIQHGRGVMTLASGDTYRGNFTNGLFDDPDGSYEFSDGSIYKGSFKLGIRNGTGSFTHRNGCNLKGTWKQGNIEGDVDLFYEQEHVGIGQVIHDRCIVEEKLHNNSRIAEMVSSLDLRLKIIRAPSANDNKPHKKCYEVRQDQGNHPKKNTYDIGFGSPNIAHYDSFNWGDVSW